MKNQMFCEIPLHTTNRKCLVPLLPISRLLGHAHTLCIRTVGLRWPHSISTSGLLAPPKISKRYNQQHKCKHTVLAFHLTFSQISSSACCTYTTSPDCSTQCQGVLAHVHPWVQSSDTGAWAVDGKAASSHLAGSHLEPYSKQLAAICWPS